MRSIVNSSERLIATFTRTRRNGLGGTDSTFSVYRLIHFAEYFCQTDLHLGYAHDWDGCR